MYYGFVADPDYILNRYYISSAAYGVGHNWGYYGTPETDAMIMNAQKETDPVKRQQMYDEIQNRIMEDCPVILYSSLPETFGHRDWVKGIQYLPAYSWTVWVYDMYNQGTPSS